MKNYKYAHGCSVTSMSPVSLAVSLECSLVDPVVGGVQDLESELCGAMGAGYTELISCLLGDQVAADTCDARKAIKVVAANTLRAGFSVRVACV